MRFLIISVSLIALASPAAAQWLNLRTPGIPRTADGRPSLAAPLPRTADGKPDLTGLWRGPGPAIELFSPDPSDVQPWAKEMARKRAEEFYKSRPTFQCLPAGPEGFRGMKRVLQTPSLIAILNEDQTYRQIFMDGRALESAPHPTWMGYSVGRWEGDVLVVESIGFNDRTWLNNVGLPHTEALRVTERYQRLDFGRLRIDVTFTDPATFAKPVGFVVNMQLAADTEMLEAVCETGSDRWTGSVAAFRESAAHVSADVVASYVGVYSGRYFERVRTVEVVLDGGTLFITGFLNANRTELIPQSDTLFTSGEGLSYEFVRDDQGVVTHVVEIHVSDNYPYQRRR